MEEIGFLLFFVAVGLGVMQIGSCYSKWDAKEDCEKHQIVQLGNKFFSCQEIKKNVP
jgi:hypothetical protein